MKEHYNLYYIFLADKMMNPMPEESRIRIRKNVLDFAEEPPP